MKDSDITPAIEKAALILSKRNLLAYKLRELERLGSEVIKDMEEITVLEDLS